MTASAYIDIPASYDASAVDPGVSWSIDTDEAYVKCAVASGIPTYGLLSFPLAALPYAAAQAATLRLATVSVDGTSMSAVKPASAVGFASAGAAAIKSGYQGGDAAGGPYTPDAAAGEVGEYDLNAAAVAAINARKTSGDEAEFYLAHEVGTDGDLRFAAGEHGSYAAPTLRLTFDDPFTAVYVAVRDALKNDAYLSAMVRSQNWGDLAGNNPDPLRLKVQDADLPEIRVIPAGGPMNPWATNKAGVAVQRLSIQVKTRRLRVNPLGAIFPIKWYLWRALSRLKGGAVSTLPFVAMFRIEGVDDVPENAELDRGKAGWSTIVDCVAEINLERAALEAE